jgi:hypothetical protein
MARTLRVQFLRGKAYEGEDFLPGAVADVEESWARRFVQSGAAILAPGEKLGDAPTLTGKSTGPEKKADPKAENRDPATGQSDDAARIAAFLDRKAEDVIKSLAAPAEFAEAFLAALYRAEEKAKGRTTVLEAITDAASRGDGK